jgi:hypothetical protein
VMAATVCIALMVANAPNGLDGIASFFPGALALLGGVPVFFLAYGALAAALLDRRPIRAGAGVWVAWAAGLMVALCLSALGVVALASSVFVEAGRIRLVDRSSLLFATAVLATGVGGLIPVVLAVLPSRGAGLRDASQGVDRVHR